MAGGTGGGGDDDLITSINVTPLVDVVLVLLIILMVTASYIVSHSIPMELPQATPEDSTTPTPRTLAVSVDSEGHLYIDAQPISDADFARLQKVFPDGVCDYSKPGIGQGPAETWLSYGTPTTPTYGGRNLPAPPASSATGWSSASFASLLTQ